MEALIDEPISQSRHGLHWEDLHGWHKKYPDIPLFEPVKTLQKLVQEGKLGVKAGEGFYNYKKGGGREGHLALTSPGG